MKQSKEQRDDATIRKALRILEDRIIYSQGPTITSPQSSIDYAKLKLAESEQEVFAVMFLDNRHRVLAWENMFYGTVDGASVHPREVVKKALTHNAAACILAHNHPSGVSEPSAADKAITERLKAALALIDVRILDHLIVGETVTSFAEIGLL